MAAYGGLPYDEEAAGFFDKSGPDMAFADQAVRLGFVRKVFGLLTAQLAITVAVTAAFVLSPGVQAYVLANQWLFWGTFVASFALVLTLACSESARRSHPTNLVLLFAFTACESVMVGLISSMYKTDVVLMAAGMTVGITACLTLYAMQTKHDFTAAGGILFSLLFSLLAAGILSMFFQSRAMSIVVAALGAAVFAAYIVFDVQLMIGSGTYSISPDEYVFAALNIYLDIINLFLYLLRLLQELQNNN